MSAPVLLRSRQGWGILLAAVTGSGLAFLDTTVVNVALPTLERGLGASLAGLQWTMDAYLLTLTAILLFGGSLGDRLGQGRVLSAGIFLFAVASVACGAAPSLLALVVARGAQGIGAALLVPNSLAVLRVHVAERDQGTAIGLWSGLSGVTTAAGPLLGGWLLGFASWRVIFFLNVPLACVALWASWRFTPVVKMDTLGKLDLPGALLAAAALGFWVYAFIEGPPHAWNWPARVCAGLGAVLLVVFVKVEASSASPMLPLWLFRSLRFVGSNLTTFAVYFALAASLFLLTLYLQQVQGRSPLAAGAAFLPVTALMLLLSPAAGWVTKKVGDRLPMTLGPLVVAGALWWLGGLSPDAPYVRGLLPPVILLGIGLGLTVAPLTTAVMSAVPREAAGVASAVNNAVARFAGLLGVAVLPALAGLASAELGGATFVHGFARAMRLCAAVSALGAATAFFTLKRRRTR